MAKPKQAVAVRSGDFSNLKFDTSTYISLTPISTLSGSVLSQGQKGSNNVAQPKDKAKK